MVLFIDMIVECGVTTQKFVGKLEKKLLKTFEADKIGGNRRKRIIHSKRTLWSNHYNSKDGKNRIRKKQK